MNEACFQSCSIELNGTSIFFSFVAGLCTKKTQVNYQGGNSLWLYWSAAFLCTHSLTTSRKCCLAYHWYACYVPARQHSSKWKCPCSLLLLMALTSWVWLLHSLMWLFSMESKFQYWLLNFVLLNLVLIVCACEAIKNKDIETVLHFFFCPDFFFVEGIHWAGRYIKNSELQTKEN